MFLSLFHFDLLKRLVVAARYLIVYLAAIAICGHDCTRTPKIFEISYSVCYNTLVFLHNNSPSSGPPDVSSKCRAVLLFGCCQYGYWRMIIALSRTVAFSSSVCYIISVLFNHFHKSLLSETARPYRYCRAVFVWTQTTE